MSYIPPLTNIQRRIWEFIRAHSDEHGYSPTFRQIGEHIGLSSTSSVSHQIRQMESKGYLLHRPWSPRALTLLDPRERVDPNEPMSVSLTREQWRAVAAGDQDVLRAALERLDLGEVA